MKKIIMCIWIVLMNCTSGFGEEISNYADCDVCHGAIHIDPVETKQIFGQEGLRQFVTIPDKSVVKLDLDGVMKPSSGSDDTGFEIKAWVRGDILYIKDLRDGSLLQFTNFDSGFMHIYLESSKEDEISLQDPVKVAWYKMQQSHIYNWVKETMDKDEWLQALPAKLAPLISQLKQQR